MEPDSLLFLLVMFFVLGALVKIARAFGMSIVQGYQETMNEPAEKVKRPPEFIETSDGARLEIIEEPAEEPRNQRLQR